MESLVIKVRLWSRVDRRSAMPWSRGIEDSPPRG